MIRINWIKIHNVELQFWGYELGNILAAIAGVGGFFAVANSAGTVASAADTGSIISIELLLSSAAELFRHQPDLAVTVFIGLIVLVSPLIRKAIEKVTTGWVLVAYDYTVVILAIMVLIFALRTDTNWVTVSGSSFVVASAFLRYGLKNPLFLKLGGIFLQMGGFSLCMFGVSLLWESENRLEFNLGWLTIATGYYVWVAGVLTYVGGKFQTDNYTGKNPSSHLSDQPDNYFHLLHPVSGVVSRTIARVFDLPYSFLCRYIANPSIFWLSRQTKKTKPFLTSMAARLPWRFFTGAVALATSTDAGVAFALANLFWALGDVAIGSIDWV